jgi:hypothetical protein
MDHSCADIRARQSELSFKKNATFKFLIKKTLKIFQSLAFGLKDLTLEIFL